MQTKNFFQDLQTIVRYCSLERPYFEQFLEFYFMKGVSTFHVITQTPEETIEVSAFSTKRFIIKVQEIGLRQNLYSYSYYNKKPPEKKKIEHQVFQAEECIGPNIALTIFSNKKNHRPRITH